MSEPSSVRVTEIRDASHYPGKPMLDFAAANVVFLVSGVEKAIILGEVLKGDGPADRYPVRAIHPTDGRLQWRLDGDAASRLGD